MTRSITLCIFPPGSQLQHFQPLWTVVKVRRRFVHSGQIALFPVQSKTQLLRDFQVLIPMKVVGDSDLIPVTGSEVKPIIFGAKRRWHSYRA